MDITAKRIETDFAQVDIVKNYLIVTINDGVDFGQSEIAQIQQIADKHISGAIGYISNHIHDYSISPVHVVKFILANPRLKHIAYVSKVGDHKSRLMALLRLIPSSVQFRTFRNIDAAVAWIEQNVDVQVQSQKKELIN